MTPAELRRAAGILRKHGQLRMIAHLPLHLAYRAARSLGRRHYRRWRPALEAQAAEMQRHLHAEPAQVQRWLERAVELTAIEQMEACLFPRLTKRHVSRLIEIRGVSHLDAALARGKGALLYSGHFRRHFLFFAALGLLGYRPQLIGLQQNVGVHPLDRWFNDRTHGVMERRLGCRFLKVTGENFGVAVQAGNALRRNEVVTIEIDHTLSRSTAGTPFLGDTADFPLGPILLAQTTGAPLLQFSLRRSTDDDVRLIADISEPFEAGPSATETLTRCAAGLEAAILADPPSWAVWLFPVKYLWQRTAA